MRSRRSSGARQPAAVAAIGDRGGDPAAVSSRRSRRPGLGIHQQPRRGRPPGDSRGRAATRGAPGRAGRPDREPPGRPGVARPRERPAPRATRRRTPDPSPHRRHPARGGRTARGPGARSGQSDQDPGRAQYRGEAAGPGRADHARHQRPRRGHPRRDHADNLGREGRHAAARPRPVGAATDAARRPGRGPARLPGAAQRPVRDGHRGGSHRAAARPRPCTPRSTSSTARRSTSRRSRIRSSTPSRTSTRPKSTPTPASHSPSGCAPSCDRTPT